MARLVHGLRAMLNLPGHHSIACIVAECEDTSNWPDRRGRNGDEPTAYNITPHIVCRISDCGDDITLEFDITTANSLENSIHKCDTIIEAMTALREGLIIEHHRAVDRWPLVPDESKYGQDPFKRSTTFRAPR